MRLKSATFFYCFLFPLLSFSQHFTGKVIELETGKPIANADVYFVELQSGTTTNEEGIFVLNDLLKSKLKIQISYLGYKTIHEEVDLSKLNEKVFYLEQSHIDLEGVVISVPGGKLQTENVVSIVRKNIVEIDQYSVSLAEAISSIPGVDQITTGSGIGKPVIRGLSGNRIVTYAQGIRIENQQWGAEHGLGVADIGVESVEVIKGPASLLYGSDALAGVLYFVDERYAQHNILEGNLETRFLSNALGSYTNAGIKLHKEGFKINIFGGYTSNADYQVPGGDRVLNTRFNDQSFKTSIGYNTKKWVSNLHYSFLHNNFGITEDADYLTSKNREVELPFQKTTQHNISFDNAYFIDDSRINLILGFSENDRKEFEESSNIAPLDLKLKTYTYNLKWYSAPIRDHWSMIFGSQGMHQTNTNFGDEVLIPNATTNDVGIFGIVDYDVGEFKLQLGLRGDQRQIRTEEFVDEDAAFPSINKTFRNGNYSIGGVYNTERMDFRLNIASGFRAPNTSELLSNGVHEGTQHYEIGNTDLKSENAIQLDFSYDYHTEHVSFSINPFFNHINNYIFLAPVDSMIDGFPVYIYSQTNAILYGGETGVHYHPHNLHWLHIEGDLSTVFAQDDNRNSLPFIPATRFNGMFKAQFSKNGIIKFKDVFLQYVYKFAQDRVGQFETSTPGYQLLNIGTNIDILTKGRPIQISTGIKNVLNTKYIDHLSRFKTMGIPNPGINFYFGIKVGFTGKIGKSL